MSFGERLKQLRLAAGLTQEQLAEAVGIAKTTITGYERGNREPDVERIKKLAAALGVSGDDLLETGISAGKRSPTKAELQAAFWGGDKDLPQDVLDALWGDVEDYAAYKLAQWKKENPEK